MDTFAPVLGKIKEVSLVVASSGIPWVNTSRLDKEHLLVFWV